MGVEIARDRKPLAERHHRRMPPAEAKPVALRDLRPAALGDDALELRRSPARCAETVAGDKVGSEVFGIWMVREPESKLWP